MVLRDGRLVIDGVAVTIATHVREGDGTAGHNRTPSYAVTVDGRDIGVVWRLSRGEPHHLAGHLHPPHADLIWFCRAPDDHPGRPRVTGPYPGIVEAVTALLERT